MKQLDSSVLRVMDPDVPRNVLLFSIVKPPQHGSIFNHNSEKPVNRRREAGPQSTVVDFTTTDLTNGTFYIALLEIHFQKSTRLAYFFGLFMASSYRSNGYS